ncbi:MAG: adenine deaminase [Methanoregulaceae archaeon]|nr:adenine deaminase [Methanoregulaceae archaeon]
MNGQEKGSFLGQARGLEPAEQVFRNAELFNPFTCGWERTDIAVSRGVVVGLGRYRGRLEHDLRGARVVPGLIDAHTHIESSLLVPSEYAKAVSAHGTTTVIADPHEIANVLGTAGISYMLSARKGLPVDIFFMLPSCVPATPMDPAGAVLQAADLAQFIGREGVLGLGEVMNVPGTLGGDQALHKKISQFSIVDGHCPGLSGKDLNAYLMAGPQSDHESTTAAEAGEKLSRGMYLYIREGSTERNVRALVPAVTPCTVPRCSFATDDRHADMLQREGHIDDCIRKAVESGLELALAIRMATLSAADRFGLFDRGAVAPGRLADFCVLREGARFEVARVLKRGVWATAIAPGRRPPCPSVRFGQKPPVQGALCIEGEGDARVIGLVRDEIVTESLRFELAEKEVPDLDRDILKLAVFSRYREGEYACGYVHGFGLQNGAIAGSISHDSHNIIAVGTGDRDILRAVSGVIERNGALVAVHEESEAVLGLECAGLMSTQPCESVLADLGRIDVLLEKIGGITNLFMYLSFLALPVIPALRLTSRGLFDVSSFSYVPVFVRPPGSL